jgi:thiol-disulfide isomerase/thioredoxin
VGGQETVSLADLRGKPVVVNFWASWCPPCRAEMPDFEALWRELQGRGVLFLGVDVGPYTGLGDREEALKFLKEIRVTYPTGPAQSAQVVVDYNIQGMPTTVFIAPDGRVKRKWTGSINKEKLRELTLQLLR